MRSFRNFIYVRLVGLCRSADRTRYSSGGGEGAAEVSFLRTIVHASQDNDLGPLMRLVGFNHNVYDTLLI